MKVDGTDISRHDTKHIHEKWYKDLVEVNAAITRLTTLMTELEKQVNDKATLVTTIDVEAVIDA